MEIKWPPGKKSFKELFLFLFLERERGELAREKERERERRVVSACVQLSPKVSDPLDSFLFFRGRVSP